ncbi:hypothetical protein [Saccharopolyspora rosea]|uniref:J domain-containing protein n=1 Tax=Saccharopolyspora rosea TaxID=524884 RepID=A0ABW3FSQ1_9PSEU|nr:hypothetical protein [Saccharopolyspora rosea]
MSADRDAVARAEFRAFVRTHHPDVGGDPAVFAAGVAEFRARRERPDRYDAPIVVVDRARGVRGLLHRLRERWARRRRPPRVR